MSTPKTRFTVSTCYTLEKTGKVFYTVEASSQEEAIKVVLDDQYDFDQGPTDLDGLFTLDEDCFDVRRIGGGE